MATFDTPETGEFSIPDDELDPGLRARKQSTKDDAKEERGRVNRGNSTDVEGYGMEAEAERQRRKADREERRKEESEQRVAKARRAAEERKEEASQQVAAVAEHGKETGVGEGEEIHTGDLAKYAKGKQTEDETQSQAAEEKSGSDQGNTELVDAITEGNNAIIGELAQLLQAMNELTSEIRSGIKVNL